MVAQLDRQVELVPRRRRERGIAPLRFVALPLLVLGAAMGCSSTPSPGLAAAAAGEPPGKSAQETVHREPRPISDTHPYQINDYLIYPVQSNKVEDLAPTVQQLFQARYGPGVVVIPHVPTNKLLIYVPPPHERQRAGAAGAASPATRGAATSRTTRSLGTRSVGRRRTR